MNKQKKDIMNKLEDDIFNDIGYGIDAEINDISNSFKASLDKALDKYKTNIFDNNGYVKRISNIDTGNDTSLKDVIDNSGIDKNISSMMNDTTELLLRKEINNIINQMPEMREAVYLLRDSIIECNTSTGDVSRTISFRNNTTKDDDLISNIYDIEQQYDLMHCIKNFIIPQTLMYGEMYIYIVPYTKIFSQLEKHETSINESIDLDSNVNYILNESGNHGSVNKEYGNDIKTLLSNISINNNGSIIIEEMGIDSCREYIMNNYSTYSKPIKPKVSNVFTESLPSKDDDGDNRATKGCYIKYLDGLKIIPIRIDRKIIGYYYVTTTLSTTPSNGISDISNYGKFKEKDIVGRMSDVIINAFNKDFLKKNINFKNEIVEILMSHKFSDGKLSFIYIPDDEIIKISINEDENGKGHSIIEPSLFPAKTYMLLNMYNLIYTLNNNTTRVHYVKSSGIDKNYASQIQRMMKKFQSRRITIDDVLSYNDVFSKMGGIGEMILPSGKSDFKAIETDTIPAVENPINIDFLETHKRQALSGSSSPNIALINAVNEVNFAKTLEMSNARYMSTVSSYKIDFNKSISRLYQTLVMYNTSIDINDIKDIKFMFNDTTHNKLSITGEMLDNFNNIVDTVIDVYYTKSEMEDVDGNPTKTQVNLKKELAKEYLPQLDFDKLDKIVADVKLMSVNDILVDKSNEQNVSNDDIDSIDDEILDDIDDDATFD